jgi:hypothetical protein
MNEGSTHSAIGSSYQSGVSDPTGPHATLHETLEDPEK